MEIQPVADVFRLQTQLEEVSDGDVADRKIHVGRKGLLVQVGVGLSWCGRDVINRRVHIRILGHPLGLSCDVIDPRMYTMILGRPVSNWSGRDGIDRETNIVPLRHPGWK